MEILKSPEFNKWYSTLDMNSKTLIDIRLTRILLDGHFGLTKKVGRVNELKFKSGLRIYYSLVANDLLLLLLGGGKKNKRSQSQDIKRATQIYQEFNNGK